MFRGTFSSNRLVWALALLSAAAFSILAALRPPPSQPWGDEGTYLAMAASLARDHDLLFQEADLEWAVSRQADTTEALILQRSERGISYSKPALYALLAAPFYALLGQSGLLVLNGLVLSFALAMAWRSLRVRMTASQCGLLLVTFLCTGALLPYVGWKISEILQASLALGGLALSLRGLREPEADDTDDRHSRRDQTTGPALGSGLLGLLVTMRLTNVVVAAIPIAAALAHKRYRRAIICAGFILVGFSLSTGVEYLLTGITNPYKATRASFNRVTGYPMDSDVSSAESRFETNRATSSLSWTPSSNIRSSAYSTVFFFVGRHTGILWYFPASLVLGLAFLRQPDRVGFILLSGSGLLVLTYLLWLPNNYFGGSTFVGNRYYLVPYMALLLAPLTLPSKKSLLLTWCVAVAVFASAVYSVAATRHLENGSQSHTRAGLFRLLPYESTARRIDGQQDRRWLGDRIRSVDPFASLRPWGFVVNSSNPPAEILFASREEAKTLRFLVLAEAGATTLQISDWKNASIFSLSKDEEDAKTIVSFELSQTWRRHPFSVNGQVEPTVKSVRSLRFKLDAQSIKPVQAWIQYLGDPDRLEEQNYSNQALRIELPVSAIAGSHSRLPISILNNGNFTWKNSPIMPVKLSYKLLSEDFEGPVEGVRTNLYRAIRPGQSLDTHVEVNWPHKPGRYQLTVDLVQENAFWFEERVGAPLAQGWVEVQPATTDSP